MSDADEYRAFILNASSQDLIRQLNLELKEPLTSSHSIVQMLMMLQNPTPTIQRKLESGELDPAQMLLQISENIMRALDVIDFYRDTLGAN